MRVRSKEELLPQDSLREIFKPNNSNLSFLWQSFLNQTAEKQTSQVVWRPPKSDNPPLINNWRIQLKIKLYTNLCQHPCDIMENLRNTLKTLASSQRSTQINLFRISLSVVSFCTPENNFLFCFECLPALHICICSSLWISSAKASVGRHARSVWKYYLVHSSEYNETRSCWSLARPFICV